MLPLGCPPTTDLVFSFPFPDPPHPSSRRTLPIACTTILTRCASTPSKSGARHPGSTNPTPPRINHRFRFGNSDPFQRRDIHHDPTMRRLAENIGSPHVPHGDRNEPHPGTQEYPGLAFVYNPPPTTLPFPTTFPPIQEFTLSTGNSCRWIPWLAQREERTPDAQYFPPEYASLQTTLIRLTFRMSFIVDTAFISPLSHFPNLVSLVVELRCWPNYYFSLTNRDVTQLSAALPRLEWLDLGLSCSLNSSPDTTVSCLLALSVHCKYSRGVWIHFNATNLVDDIRFLSEDPDLRGLRELLTRSPLKRFYAGSLRFPNVTDRDITTIAEGFMDIFPSICTITSINGSGRSMLKSRVYQLQEMQTRVFFLRREPPARVHSHVQTSNALHETW